MLTNSLICVYACTMAVVTLLWLSRRITQKQYMAWMASVYAFAAVLCAVNGWRTLLYLNAGLSAWYAWMWWHSGGGDGPRRRWKAWADCFQGVRRTAPAGV
jgi:hypothetical protein